MALYQIHFVDHGDNIFSTHHVEEPHDEAVIARARRMDVPSIGAGFEVWESERLVHRERR
ncbi:MAG TPA: hypothetical protein VMI30_04970 [Stellaceae bacterium]|nr:hypothetical protein [Stellaceae bacterium]